MNAQQFWANSDESDGMMVVSLLLLLLLSALAAWEIPLIIALNEYTQLLIMDGGVSLSSLLLHGVLLYRETKPAPPHSLRKS